MPKILVHQAFPFAPDGNRVVRIETGEQEVSDRCAIVAVDHLKVATLAGEAQKNDRPRVGKKPSAR
ncbi:hypothetical protein [Stutzerimonas kunmingensis]|uniref:hypothetical protein n=1 Tax=Stutzerimonas kunmingensis TaxID=1211807 RepID=UPI00241E8543|nr:hypothetical protein [Stutzerimonas kunmingensis]